MVSYSVAVKCLCAVASVVGAARTKRHASHTGVDFQEAIDKMKEIDRVNDADIFTIFETDGNKLTEALSPPPASCSVETMKSALLECPKRGKVCIALYKFNYPVKVGSSTLKGKSVLIQAQDKALMGEALGGTFAVTRVSMSVVQFVWSPLKNALSVNSVSPAAILELSDSAEVSGLDAESLWSKVAAKVSRVGATEKEAFIKHAEDQNARVSGSVPSVPTVTEQENGDSENGDTVEETNPVNVPVVTPTLPQAPAATQVDMKKLIKEVEEAVSKNVEATARKIAREEVGNAIRKLGTDMGEKVREVGKTWLDKSRQ